MGTQSRISVLPNRLAVMRSESYVGSTYDISVMSCRPIIHKNKTRKNFCEESVEGFGQLSVTYPGNWGV